jgi:hypothetical protein
MLGVPERDPYACDGAMRPVGGRDGITGTASTGHSSKWGRGLAASAGPDVREVPGYR